MSGVERGVCVESAESMSRMLKRCEELRPEQGTSMDSRRKQKIRWGPTEGRKASPVSPARPPDGRKVRTCEGR